MVLREQVTSPAGTTAAALRELEVHKVRAAFLAAMEAARDRSRALAEGDWEGTAVAGLLPLAWGCTPAELARRYPADDRAEELVRGPVLRMTRAVDVDASQARVWRAVCQIAVAPYSYDWIDNRGRPSPRAPGGGRRPRGGGPAPWSSA